MNFFCREILIIAAFNIFFLWGQSEFLIDSTFIGGIAAYDQRHPAAGFDGVNYLVVWADERSSQSSDIFGTRITPSGTILDSCVIAISTAPGDQVSPAVAFDGVNYFVVWASDYGIYGARINQEGHMLDPAGIVLSTTEALSGPHVAYDGRNYLVVWKRYGSVVGKRVSPSGIVLDSSYIIITASYSRGAPSIAYGSSNYFVVWQDSRNYPYSDDSSDIYGARVSPLGIVLDTAGVAISTELPFSSSPSVAYDGTNFFIVWNFFIVYQEQYFSEVYGARVNQSAVLLDTAGILIGDHLSIHPAVTYGFGMYFVTWQHGWLGGGNVVGTRIDPSGVVVDTSSIYIAHIFNYELGYPSVIGGIRNYYVVWHNVISYFDIYGTAVTRAGHVVNPGGILLSTSVANSQWNSAVAFDGTNYLTVWADDRYSQYNYPKIYGRRVSDSSVLDSVIPIFVDGIYVRKDYPAVAFGCTNYLVVWQAYGIAGHHRWHIYGALVTPDGVVLSPEIPIATSPAAYKRYPAIAFDDTNYLVVWERNSDNGNIEAARVNQNGTVLDSVPIAIATNYYSELSPAVAFDGTNYLVVWEDERDWASSDIYATRISRSGMILDSEGIRISKEDVCRDPAVAFDGNNYFVVWQSDNLDDIYGTRVSPSGTVIDSIDILIIHTTWYDYHPRVVFDGENYVIIWENQGSIYFPIYSGIVGAKVDTSGTVIDSFVISEQLGDQISPSMAHGRDEQIFIAYTGWTDSINTYPINTMRIWGKFYPFIGIEEDVGLSRRKMRIDMQVYPNPINRVFNIEYFISQKMKVSISVFDVTGRLMKRLASDIQDVGYYHKVYEMTDFAQGVYFIRLETENQSEIQKVVFVK
ncbi:MAG: T9SS type A sorting domain-containing protein [Dehalococcoidia bacterium]|nr:MAG: T9SS type A sorting domain-containing protein [Dehalococcoidia bacterium]